MSFPSRARPEKYFEGHKTPFLRLYADALSSSVFHVTCGVAWQSFLAGWELSLSPQLRTAPNQVPALGGVKAGKSLLPVGR